MRVVQVCVNEDEVTKATHLLSRTPSSSDETGEVSSKHGKGVIDGKDGIVGPIF